MPKVTHLQTNFAAGELSPRLYGRVDVSRYQSGCRTLRNAHPVVQGGAKKRDGWVYLGATKTASARSRLIPFVFNQSQAYALEFGNLYMRVWKVAGQVLSAGNPYEIVTPFTTAQLAAIDYTQSADVMLLFHKDVAPQTLTRLADDSWTLAPTTFSQQPTDEQGTTPATTCTPSAKDPQGAAITLTLGAAGWVAGDVGKVVRINGGSCKITGYTSSTIVDATILRVLNATVAAEADSWTLEEDIWSTANGWPTTGTFHDQRLILAGSTAYPTTISGSRPGEPYDFTMGTADDDAFRFEISADQMNPIIYVSAMRVLVALGYGGEFTVQGGVEKPLTPTNVQVRQRSNHGAALIRPVRVAREEVFAQRSGKKVLALAYNVANDDFESTDLTLLAEHLGTPGIADLCWQQEPDRLLWVARDDGKFLSLTLERNQDVLGWAQHETAGEVESLCSIPGAGGDRVFAVIQRTVDGSTVRYVELMQAGVYVDSALLGTSDPGAAVWTGLDHLEGCSVKVWADGVSMGSLPVAGGEITLPRAAYSVQIGMPFTVTVECLPPEMQTGMGAASGNNMRTNRITLRVLSTSQCKVNDQTVAFRQFGSELLDQPVPQSTGIHTIENLGFDRGESPVIVTHDDPLPFHLLSITRSLTIND